MDGVKKRKNQRERNRAKALRNNFMELRRRLPFPEEQVKTRAKILISAAEYVDALERRICQMQDSQLGEGGNIEEEVRMSLPGCRFSTVSFLYFLCTL